MTPRGLLPKIKSHAVIIFGFVLIAIFSYIYFNHALDIRFVDEEENIVLGSYLIKGEKLYKDLFLQHQPSGYLLSAVIQKITNPQSIYTLIVRHREFMILWSFFWALLLVYKFKLPALVFVTLYELTKILVFGDLFLAESIITYPLSFIILNLLNQSKMFGFSLSLSTFLTAFMFLTLLPTWPLLVFAYCYLIFISKPKPSEYKFIILGILPFFIVFPFMSIKDYINQTLVVNFTNASLAEQNVLSVFSAFFYPFIIFTRQTSQTLFLSILRFLSAIFLFELILLLVKNKPKKVLLLFFLLGLSGLRYVPPGSEYYRGFHHLVWYSTFLVSISYGFSQIYSKKQYLLISLVLVVFTFFSTKDLLLRKIDKNERYYINYSRQFDFGEAIKIMKYADDKLLVVPDDMLVYWQSDAHHASKYLFFYSWMTETPAIFGEAERLFERNPPEFYYCDCMGSLMFNFSSNYVRVKKSGYDTNLFVSSEVFKKLDQEKRRRLNFYNFEI